MRNINTDDIRRQIRSTYFVLFSGLRVLSMVPGTCFESEIVRAEYASGKLPILIDTIVSMVRILYVCTNTYVQISHRVAILLRIYVDFR